MSEIVVINNGQAVTTTLVISDGAGYDHASVIKLVRKYAKDLMEFGLLDFKSESSGGRPTEYAGQDLKQFMALLPDNFRSQISSMTRSLILWTERGEARHPDHFAGCL